MIKIIVECILLGVISSFVGIFYNYSLQNNSIFGKFGSLLNKLSKKKGFLCWISNPLGACIYCSTTWITIFIVTIYWVSWEVMPKWEIVTIGILSAIGMQHIIIRIWCLIDN